MMENLKSKKHKWIIALLIAAIALPLTGIILNAIVNAQLKKMVEGKGMWESSATVIFKERMRFDETNNEWYDEDRGNKVYREPGSEDLRVYYRIDSFDPSDEPTSSRLLVIEKKRMANGKFRYRTNSPEEYDRIKVGDTIKVRYQRFSNDTVLMW